MPDEGIQDIPAWKLPSENPDEVPVQIGAKQWGLIALLIVLIAIVVGLSGWIFWNKMQASERITGIQCKNSEMVFYYDTRCPVCQRVEEEGTVEKIESLGIKKVEKIEIRTGPIKHKFSAVPTFVINGKVYTGYRTFEELKELLHC